MPGRETSGCRPPRNLAETRFVSAAARPAADGSPTCARDRDRDGTLRRSGRGHARHARQRSGARRAGALQSGRQAGRPSRTRPRPLSPSSRITMPRWPARRSKLCGRPNPSGRSNRCCRQSSAASVTATGPSVSRPHDSSVGSTTPRRPRSRSRSINPTRRPNCGSPSAVASARRSSICPALERAIKVFGKTESPALRLEAVRVMQIALGDCGPGRAVAPMFDGYTSLVDLKSHERELDALRIRDRPTLSRPRMPTSISSWPA